MASGANGPPLVHKCPWPGKHKGPVLARMDLPIPERICTLHYSEWNGGRLTPAAAAFAKRYAQRKVQEILNNSVLTSSSGE